MAASFVAAKGVRRPRVVPSRIHGRWGGPDSHGHLGLWRPAGCSYHTAPEDRGRESNARHEGHNLGSWPLNDRGHRAPKKPGIRGPLGRIERPKARLQDECQTRSGVSGIAATP